jgi:hypothetical protein
LLVLLMLLIRGAPKQQSMQSMESASSWVQLVNLSYQRYLRRILRASQCRNRNLRFRRNPDFDVGRRNSTFRASNFEIGEYRISTSNLEFRRRNAFVRTP